MECETITVTSFSLCTYSTGNIRSRRNAGGLGQVELGGDKSIGSLVPIETRKPQYLGNYAGREVDGMAGLVANLF